MLRLGTDNMGYVVFAIRRTWGNDYIVAAANPDAVQPYVTWAATDEPVSFYWGHYFSDIDSAMADLADRFEVP